MNYWNQEGIPHKGWDLKDVIDTLASGATWDIPYETCMMCGKEKIRFVHIVTHSEVNEEFRVGCVCAEKMTGDYINPKSREKELLNRANRRANWVNKDWKISKTGNFYLKIQGNLLVIFRDRKSNKFKVKIGETFGNKEFTTLQEAKTAAFNGMEYFKERGEW